MSSPDSLPRIYIAGFVLWWTCDDGVRTMMSSLNDYNIILLKFIGSLRHIYTVYIWDIIDCINATLFFKGPRSALSDGGATWDQKPLPGYKDWGERLWSNNGNFPMNDFVKWFCLSPPSSDLFSFILNMVFPHRNTAAWSHLLGFSSGN